MKIRISILFFALMLCTAQAFAAGKILYIDSYHEGYAWSDGITAGVKEGLKGKGVELKIIHLDTKRNPDEEFKQKAALNAKVVIEAFSPNVVIAADDNAAKYVIMPYYKNAKLPFVFCGINWDASVYGMPYSNTTGMIEVTPIPQLLDYLKKFAKGDRIGFLGPDLLTARKEAENYKKVFGLNLVEYYAKDYGDWKKGYVELQTKSDILIIDSDGGLYNEYAADMKKFAEDNAKIPSGSCYDFTAPLAMISFGKVAQEQGFWAAGAALKILGGAAPSSIPIAKNKDGQLIINARIAKKLNVDLPYDIMQSAALIIE